MEENKLRIVGCVVWYKPDEESVNNIKTYPPFLEKVFVLDNSPEDNSALLEGLGMGDKVVYVPFLQNKGIAYALAKGVELAIKEKADYLLTMDQDSGFPTKDSPTILSWLEKKEVREEFGLLGLNYKFKKLEKELARGEIIYDDGNIDSPITSGSFINIANYKKVKGFRVEFFIDYVDLDLNWQFKKAGFKVAYLNQILLQHHLGSLAYKKVLWHTFMVVSHSPLRRYYQYRNLYVLYHEDKKYWWPVYRDFIGKTTIKWLVFDKNRRASYKMMRRGIRDAKKGILGEYQPDEKKK